MEPFERYAIQTGKILLNDFNMRTGINDLSPIDKLILFRVRQREILQEQMQKKNFEKELEKQIEEKITKAIQKAFDNI